jgi:uncharacterized protein YndB with AHSA1/START domain
MWIALAIGGGLVALIAALAIVGLFLRPGHVITRSAVIARPPADVWAALVDVAAQPTWRKDLKRVELLPAEGGKRQFREHGGQGAVRYVVDEETPPSRLVTRIADENLPYGGRWLIELAPDGAGTRVTVTEDGFVKNPIFRTLSRTVFSLSATTERWLRDLAQHLA